jgi:hypothetical protein
MVALRGDISFRYLKQFFLVLTKINCITLKICSKADSKAQKKKMCVYCHMSKKSRD